MQATTQKRLPMVTTTMDKLGTNTHKGFVQRKDGDWFYLMTR
ncbi:MAG: hypothetical protein ACLT8V_00120 [Streptococcus salivarius]